MCNNSQGYYDQNEEHNDVSESIEDVLERAKFFRELGSNLHGAIRKPKAPKHKVAKNNRRK